MARALIDYRRQQFSQSGEDGIIARIFEVVGEGERFCCEFGAWDGVHLSNTRALVENGWSALLIEGEPGRFRDLEAGSRGNSRIVCACAFVDTGTNHLANILTRHDLASRRLDLLSIDIDGLDYEIFDGLDRLRQRPRLVVVEVHPEHGPARRDVVPRELATENVGQPLAWFVERGRALGYRLVCYHGGNAFFLAEDAGGSHELPTLSPDDAWTQSLALYLGDVAACEYLFRRNLGLTGSRYKFDSVQLSAENLGLSKERASELIHAGAKVRRKAAFRRLRAALRARLGFSSR